MHHPAVLDEAQTSPDAGILITHQFIKMHYFNMEKERTCELSYGVGAERVAGYGFLD
jgi:hypothetical protein